MQTFSTRTQTWELSITIEACTRIRAHLNLDLLKPDQPDAAGRVPVLQLYSDPELLLKCVSLCLHLQLKEKFAAQISQGIKDEITGEPLSLLDLFALDFGEGHFEAMRSTFFEVLRDFFRRLGLPEKGAVISKQLEIIEQAATAGAEKVSALNTTEALNHLQQIDLQKQFDQSIRGTTSSNSPPSPTATPAL